LYIWAPAPPGMDGESFARLALEEALVSLTPGMVFGQAGRGHVRISFTAPLERIELAMQRLADWMAK
ncbi:MAG: LL-diaminopimelate aminotransferase, partial [Anaerolineales bacterium]|nr:LL-diaminopimelate aminotransferase [Anaerolineales bacterium]